MKKKETKACKVNIEIYQNQNQKKKVSGMFKVRREKNFPNFFFDFLVQNDSIRKKKQNIFLKNLIFFLSLRNVGDFDPFDPWRENQSFFLTCGFR